jgi:hypothetical protein
VGIAALAITGEFATGSIRTTVAATPSRWAVLTAKAAVVGALTSLLVVGLGAILRSAAGTITTAVAVLFAPPILLGAWAVGALAAGMIALHRRDP